jgi:hypothetical protein
MLRDRVGETLALGCVADQYEAPALAVATARGADGCVYDLLQRGFTYFDYFAV